MLAQSFSTGRYSLAGYSKNDADSLLLYFDDLVDSTPLTREREVERDVARDVERDVARDSPPDL